MAGLFGSEENKNIIEKYFGFRENPFGVTPDPRFFYDHSMYMEGLSQLIYGIQAQKGIMLLTGDGGTGKTVLVRKLMRHLPTTQFIVASSSHLTTAGLLELTVQELGLAWGANPGVKMMQQLERALVEQLQQKRYVTLLLDEAQELSDDTLQGLCELSNLETDKDKLLQIILVAQPELVQRLSSLALQRIKQRIAMHYRLFQLPAQSDVEQYVRHRLEVAGYAGPPLFDLDAIEAIWSYSRGTPRLINALCDNSLPIAASAGRKKVMASMVEKAASLLMLERSTERRTEPEIGESTKTADRGEEPPVRQKLTTIQPAIQEAKIVEKPAAPPRVKEPALNISQEQPPAGERAKGLESPARQKPPAEDADLKRLKAALAIPLRAHYPDNTARSPSQPPQSTALSRDALENSWTPAKPMVDDDSSRPDGPTMVTKVNVPVKFFDFMVHEATEALGPLGKFVVHEHISGMGETRETFPRKKLEALIEAVSGEIGNPVMRANFEATTRREIRGFRSF